jgi:cation:H+ antiporter
MIRELASFFAAIALMSWASMRLTRAIEGIAAHLRFTDGLLGIVAALGADAPEICSAIAALLSRDHEVGLGVVLGSNIFNLAGLLGLSAVVAGRVAIGREGLWFNGVTSLLGTVLVLALVLGWIPPWALLLALASVLAPYVRLTAMHPAEIGHLRVPVSAKRFLETAVGHAHRASRKRAVRSPGSWRDGTWALVSVVLIVVAAFAAVRSAVTLAARSGVSRSIVGTVVLAALTSIPNVIAAVQLARENRGEAVVSESLNSNTLNILFGICLPALAIGFVAPSPQIVFAALWLLGMNLVSLGAAGHKRGLHRLGGMLIIALYLIFAVVILMWR